MTTQKAKLDIPRDRNDLGWSCGAAAVGTKTFRVQVKWFDEPSDFGIQRGRVSKLHVAVPGGGTLVNYDRGWDVRPRTPEAKAVFEAVLAEFN